MKKLLYFLIIVLFYSCCAKKSATKISDDKYYQPITSTGKGKKSKAKPIYKMSPAPEPIVERPEPKPVPDRSVEEIIYQPNVPQDGTIVRNVRPINGRTTARVAEESFKPFEFTKGDINFVVKDTMIVGVITEVNMTISKDVDIHKIISEIKTFTDSNLHTDSVRIAPVMRARLVDPSGGVNFKIVDDKTKEEQSIEAGDYTRWTWYVTPLNKGNNKLSMVVDIVYDKNSKTYQVYDGVIYVYSAETFYDKLMRFLINNWQYLLSTLLLPFIYFIYTLFRKKK